MIFNELKLSNFCVYRGEHEFNLAPRAHRGKAKPVVLFSGMNGGGKTTILDAVQLVRYGKRAKCSKRGEKSYEDFLRSCINHDVDPQLGASIGLTLSLRLRRKRECLRNLTTVVGRNGRGDS